MSKIALQLINKEKQEKTGRLDLSNCDLMAIPEAIQELEGLQFLNLSSNQITDISLLQKLEQLQTLNLSRNQITNFSFLQKLEQLRKLNLSFNQISDISILQKLEQLRNLDLQRNQITDISILQTLKRLQHLHLHENQITDISVLQKLEQLQTLNLSRNQITNFSSLQKLKQLQLLYLRSNQITDISFLQKLEQLRNLSLSFNQISDISFLQKLEQLNYLNLYSNQITNISVPQKLEQLQTLNLGLNQITDLSGLVPLLEATPMPVSMEPHSGGLSLSDNPVATPPVEIVKQGKEAILAYFKQQQKHGEAPLYEAKLMILGEGDVGKTTFAKLLLNPNHSVKKNTSTSTLGVQIHTGKKIRHQHNHEVEIKAHLWDFGGQDIQYMLHQFFITKDCLYVIVSDKRKENTRFRYWFQIIEMLGPDSPVLVLENPKNIASYNEDFPLQKYRKLYPKLNIQNQEVDLACIQGKAASKWQVFNELIEGALSQLPVVNQPVIATWAVIRETLEHTNEKYLIFDELYKLVQEVELNGKKVHLSKEEVKLCLSYLKKIGDLTYFSDHQLDNYIFLDHNWLIEGLYFILSDPKIAEDHGVFTRSQAYKKWEQKPYSELEKSMLLQLLLKDKFDICYPVPGTKEQFIAPILLATDLPGPWAHKTDLQFAYRYEFIPYGLFSRLIVRLSERIDGEGRWKTGVRLVNDQTFAEVELIEDQQFTILINLSGDSIGCREMLDFIAHELDSLHGEFPHLKVHKEVACNCPTCKNATKNKEAVYFHQLKTLNGALAKKSYQVTCHKSYEPVNIGTILNDLITEEAGKSKYFEDTFYTLKELGMSINQINNINNNTNTASSNSNSNSSSKAKAENQVSIHISIDNVLGEVGTLTEDLEDNRDLLIKKGMQAEALSQLEKEIQRVEQALEAMQQSPKNPAPRSKNRFKNFLTSLSDEESTLRKAMSFMGKTPAYLKGLATSCNELAQNLNLEGIPLPF